MTNLDTIKAEAVKKFEEKFMKHKMFARGVWGFEFQNLEDALLSEIDRAVEAATKVDHSIDVRYETDVLKAFDKFIKKWCGIHYPHLIDNDENDGQFMRDKIDDLLQKLSFTKETK